MSELETSLHLARKRINDVVNSLARAAITDSLTYQGAIQKLRDYRCKFTGKSADFLLIDEAIKIVENEAFESEVIKTKATESTAIDIKKVASALNEMINENSRT